MNPKHRGRRRLPYLPMAALMAASACTEVPEKPAPCLLYHQDIDGSITCMVPRGPAPAPPATPVPARKPVDELRAVGAGGA